MNYSVLSWRVGALREESGGAHWLLRHGLQGPQRGSAQAHRLAPGQAACSLPGRLSVPSSQSQPGNLGSWGRFQLSITG